MLLELTATLLGMSALGYFSGVFSIPSLKMHQDHQNIASDVEIKKQRSCSA